jgi:hypothetical protein
VLHVNIGKVEVYALHQHVRGYKGLGIGKMQYGTIVTNALDG